MIKQTKKQTTISVPIDAVLLDAVDRCAEKLHYDREQFLLMACQQFIRQVDVKELERIYCQRYKQQPEALDWAIAGATLAGDILP